MIRIRSEDAQAQAILNNRRQRTSKTLLIRIANLSLDDFRLEIS